MSAEDRESTLGAGRTDAAAACVGRDDGVERRRRGPGEVPRDAVTLVCPWTGCLPMCLSYSLFRLGAKLLELHERISDSPYRSTQDPVPIHGEDA